MDSREAFWDSYTKAKDDLRMLHAIYYVCGANFIAMVSIALNLTFWKDYPIISGIITILYFFIINGCVYDNRSKLLSTGIERLRDWSRFTISADCTYYQFAPHVSNEDFFYISDKSEKGEYLRFLIDYHKISLSDIESRDIVYSCQRDSRTTMDELLRVLYYKLKDDGKVISSIYNKYGDEKWRHGVIGSKPSKTKEWIYNISVFVWLFLKIIVAFFPIYALAMY